MGWGSSASAAIANLSLGQPGSSQKRVVVAAQIRTANGTTTTARTTGEYVLHLQQRLPPGNSNGPALGGMLLMLSRTLGTGCTADALHLISPSLLRGYMELCAPRDAEVEELFPPLRGKLRPVSKCTYPLTVKDSDSERELNK